MTPSPDVVPGAPASPQVPRRVTAINVAVATKRSWQGRELMTAIGKQPVEGPVVVAPLGLAGDEQADLSVHGGLSKAVYAYPIEHHGFWQTVRAQAGVADWGAPLSPGTLGENLSLQGLLESEVWVGDVLQFADCVLAVSEPRLPCEKLNAALGFKHAVKLMTQSGWCGYYLSVRVPGTLRAGEAFELLPGPREVRITELFRARARRAD